MSDALRSLKLHFGLHSFDCLLSRRLELGQVQTKLSLHASKGCSSQVVAAYVVCSHGGKVFDHGFGGGHRASRTTEERVGLGDSLPEIHKRYIVGQTGLMYLLSSKVNVEPPLQQFIGHQSYTKLR